MSVFNMFDGLSRTLTYTLLDIAAVGVVLGVALEEIPFFLRVCPETSLGPA